MGVLREFGKWEDDDSVILGEAMLPGEARVFERDDIEGKVRFWINRVGTKLVVEVEGDYDVLIDDFDNNHQFLSSKDKFEVYDFDQVSSVCIFWTKSPESEVELALLFHREK